MSKKKLLYEFTTASDHGLSRAILYDIDEKAEVEGWDCLSWEIHYQGYYGTKNHWNVVGCYKTLRYITAIELMEIPSEYQITIRDGWINFLRISDNIYLGCIELSSIGTELQPGEEDGFCNPTLKSLVTRISTEYHGG